MRGQRTPLRKAALLKAKLDSGEPMGQAANEVGIPKRTCVDIMNGHNGWSQIIAENAVFNSTYQTGKRKLQLAFQELANKCVERAEATIEDAGFYHAALGAGIFTDKMRALAGEADTTINVAIDARRTDNLEALAVKLFEAVQLRAARDAIETTGRDVTATEPAR